LSVQALFNKGGKDAGGNKEDAARKAIQDSFNPKKFGNFFGDQASKNQKPETPAPGGGSGSGSGAFGGMFGGGGGGGFGSNATATGGEGGGAERPIWVELLEMLRYIWVILWNTALFLWFANVLHRSLDWCCQVELLLLVGAPQQAWERVAARLFAHLEWFEKNILGWDIPGDEDSIPMYENIKLYYPQEHAYTFDAYRYKDMTDAEKKKLLQYHALRYYERDGGVRGDVDAADVGAIRDKYEPMEADRRAYRKARDAGKLDEYWAARKEAYNSLVRGGPRV